MSLFKEKYHFVSVNGDEYSMTADQLYKRVMRDSESDYNWITSATELVRVCNQFTFPKKYAQEIQIAILNCFANIETRNENDSSFEDADAVNFCYNSLADVSAEANKVRRKYLKAVIERFTMYHSRLLEFDYYGPTFHRICEEWKRIKFEEYSSIASLDFKKLRKYLDGEFDKIMKTAQEDGVFQKDEERHLEVMRRFWSSSNMNDS